MPEEEEDEEESTEGDSDEGEESNGVRFLDTSNLALLCVTPLIDLVHFFFYSGIYRKREGGKRKRLVKMSNVQLSFNRNINFFFIII